VCESGALAKVFLVPPSCRGKSFGGLGFGILDRGNKKVAVAVGKVDGFTFVQDGARIALQGGEGVITDRLAELSRGLLDKVLKLGKQAKTQTCAFYHLAGHGYHPQAYGNLPHLHITIGLGQEENWVSRVFPPRELRNCR
jgi:hypothetical protein